MSDGGATVGKTPPFNGVGSKCPEHQFKLLDFAGACQQGCFIGGTMIVTAHVRTRISLVYFLFYQIRAKNLYDKFANNVQICGCTNVSLCSVFFLIMWGLRRT